MSNRSWWITRGLLVLLWIGAFVVDNWSSPIGFGLMAAAFILSLVLFMQFLNKRHDDQYKDFFSHLDEMDSWSDDQAAEFFEEVEKRYGKPKRN